MWEQHLYYGIEPSSYYVSNGRISYLYIKGFEGLEKILKNFTKKSENEYEIFFDDNVEFLYNCARVSHEQYIELTRQGFQMEEPAKDINILRGGKIVVPVTMSGIVAHINII